LLVVRVGCHPKVQGWGLGNGGVGCGVWCVGCGGEGRVVWGSGLWRGVVDTDGEMLVFKVVAWLWFAQTWGD
jgi:hypothetical protein